MPGLPTFWLKLVTHVGALLPLALIIWDFTRDQLTADPIREITLRTGSYSLILLVLSLACTPLSNVFGLKLALLLRRPLGLYGFIYAVLHVLNFIGLDYRFDLNLLREDVFGKVYIWVGLAAWLALLPVAITSTRGWRQRLGRNWARLHWLVYPAILLSVAHFLLLVKADIREPLLYGIITLLWLFLRWPGVKKVVRYPRRWFQK